MVKETSKKIGTLTDQNVVGFQICVEKITLFQEAEAKKHLLCVSSDCFEINSYISAELL